MEYKYYTAMVFDTLEAATAFTISYHIMPNGAGRDEATRYCFPVSVTEQGSYCAVVYDLNTLSMEDLGRITIEKVNTDFINLD